MHHKRASVAAEETVIVDGQTTPEMVKAIFIVLQDARPDTRSSSSTTGKNITDRSPPSCPACVVTSRTTPSPRPTPAAARPTTAGPSSGSTTSPRCSAAAHSPEWQALREDGATLFAYPMGVGVARERIQKDLDWTYNDWGVNALSEDEVRQRLQKDGYKRLAADPRRPAQDQGRGRQQDARRVDVGAHRHDRFVPHRRTPGEVAQIRIAWAYRGGPPSQCVTTRVNEVVAPK